MSKPPPPLLNQGSPIAAETNQLLLTAALQHESTHPDEAILALSVRLLRDRQLARSDVRQKLAEIEKRKRTGVWR